MLRDSVVAFAAVVRTRSRAIPFAIHDNHEKINSLVSFSLPYGYGAPPPELRYYSILKNLP